MRDTIANDHDQLHVQSLTYVLAIGGIVGCVDPLLEKAVSIRPIIALCCGVALLALIPVLRWTRNVRVVAAIGVMVIAFGYYLCWILSGDNAYLAQGLAIPVSAALFLRRTDAAMVLAGYCLAAIIIGFSMSTGWWEPPYTPASFGRGHIGEALSVVLIALALSVPTIWREHHTRQAIAADRASKRKAMEHQRRLEKVVNTSFGAMLESDENGIVLSGKGKLLSELGYDCDRLVGTNQFDLFCDGDRLKLMQIAPSSSEFEFNDEVRIVDADGKGRGVRLTVASFLDSNGDKRLVSAIRDIENEIQTRERLNEIDRLEGLATVCAGLAHDFNNLLTVFGIQFERIKDEALRDELKESQEQASNLTNGLLSFARRRPAPEDLVEIGDLADSIAPIIERIAGDAVDCHWQVECPGSSVRADRSQLQQLFVNLATNARHAMPEGGSLRVVIDEIEITNGTKHTHDRREHLSEIEPGTYVRIEMTDTGIGMDDETLSRAIQPFYTTKPRGIGTGLGLSTTHGTVRSVGGTMWIDSSLGESTTVTTLFPKCWQFGI